MPWLPEIVGYVNPIGHAYCVEHAGEPTPGHVVIMADTKPATRCDYPGCHVVLGGEVEPVTWWTPDGKPHKRRER